MKLVNTELKESMKVARGGERTGACGHEGTTEQQPTEYHRIKRRYRPNEMLQAAPALYGATRLHLGRRTVWPPLLPDVIRVTSCLHEKSRHCHTACPALRPVHTDYTRSGLLPRQTRGAMMLTDTQVRKVTGPRTKAP